VCMCVCVCMWDRHRVNSIPNFWIGIELELMNLMWNWPNGWNWYWLHVWCMHMHTPLRNCPSIENEHQHIQTTILSCFLATRDTINMSQKMASVGAKAVLVVTPCYYKGRMTNEALERHYTKVLDVLTGKYCLNPFI